MKKNMGTADKVLRIFMAAAVIVGYLTNMISGAVATVLGILAGVLLLTAFIGFCPLYLPFGINTLKRKR